MTQVSTNWRVDYHSRDGWTPFWFFFESTAREAFARWGKHKAVRLVHLDGDRAEVIEEALHA